MPEDGDTFTMAVGAHLLPTATVDDLEYWATTVRTQLGIGPGRLTHMDHSRIRNHTRCTTAVVDVREGYSTGRMEISSRPAGARPGREEYALLLRTANDRYRPFPERGTRSQKGLAEVATKYHLHWAQDISQWDPVMEAERFLQSLPPPQPTERARLDQIEGWSIAGVVKDLGYEGGGSGRSHPENADPDQQVATRMKLSTPY
eukprot:COSAG05_NODE_205_length_14184_cov_81.700887_8_plen_203_part_00